MQPITLTPAPVHIVQYRNSPHAYGCTFTTRATTTRGIAKAAARAAAEDNAYWRGTAKYAAPVVTSIDFCALLPRDWHDPQMWRFMDMIDREASKPRAPRMHESAEHPSRYAASFLK